MWFRNSVYKKNERKFVKEYIVYALVNNDENSTKLLYDYFVKNNNLSDKELGAFWQEVINCVIGLDINAKDKTKILEQLTPIVNEVGACTTNLLSVIAKHFAILQDAVDKEKNNNSKQFKFLAEDNHAWRKSITPTKTKYANPYVYETQTEFENAVAQEYSKQEDFYNYDMKKHYFQNQVCSFCKVDLKDVYKVLPYYLTGGLDLSVGDEVVVPFGSDNKETCGVVVSVGKCYASTFPFDVTKIKKVIKKK